MNKRDFNKSNELLARRLAETQRPKLRRLIAERGLCSLANETKWDEFLTAMWAEIYARDAKWMPKHRHQCIGAPPSRWDSDWYNLPPMKSLTWLDVSLQEQKETNLPERSLWLQELLRRIGLEYQAGHTIIRIFGYSPKNFDLFDE